VGDVNQGKIAWAAERLIGKWILNVRSAENQLSSIEKRCMDWNHRPMQLSLSWILPIVQVPAAIFLLQWARVSQVVQQKRFDTLYSATPALVCGGINAPAMLFSALAALFDRVDHPVPTLFGFTLDYVFFLIGIVILWYVVGSVLDQRQSARREPRLVWTMSTLVLLGGPLALLGALLFYVSLQGLLTPWRWNNYSGNIVRSVLFLLWSFVLIGLPAIKVTQRLRQNTSPTPD
jgi:hypothetical protein